MYVCLRIKTGKRTNLLHPNLSSASPGPLPFLSINNPITTPQRPKTKGPLWLDIPHPIPFRHTYYLLPWVVLAVVFLLACLLSKSCSYFAPSQSTLSKQTTLPTLAPFLPESQIHATT